MVSGELWEFRMSETGEDTGEDFNLSEKRISAGTNYIYKQKDVKEFIRLLKEEIKEKYKWNKKVFFELIDKLAGDKLK